MSKSLLLTVGAACLLNVVASAQQARNEVQLDDPNNVVSPAGFYTWLRGDGDLRVALWLDDRDNTSDEDVFIAVSTDAGLNYGSEINVSQGSINLVDVDFPELAVDSGTIHCLWDDDRTAGGDSTVYARSTDNGVTFTETVIAQPTNNHRMAADGSDVVIIYSANALPNEIFSVWSSDGGATFGAPVAIDPANTGVYDVDNINVTVQGGTAHVIASDDRNGDNDLWYSQATNGGAWSAAARLDSAVAGEGLPFFSTWPPGMDVVADGSNVHVVWMEDSRAGAGTNEAVYYNSSNDGGTTWNGEQRIGQYTVGTHDCDFAYIAVDGSNVVITWADDRSGVNPTYIAVSNDGGVTWMNDFEVPNGGIGTAVSQYVGAFVDCNTIIVGWEDDSYTTATIDEYPAAIVSVDAGASWNGPLVFGNNFQPDEDADLSSHAWYFENGSINACWQTDGGSAGPDGVFAGGMRIPSIEFLQQGNFAQFKMSLVDTCLAGDLARWAASTALGSQVHPENPALSLDIGPGGIYNKSLAKANILTRTVQADGTAETNAIPVKASLVGKTLFFQGWVNSGGVGMEPSDVVSAVIQ